MRGVTRRRWMGAIVAFVLVWPAVHMRLVATAGIDAWEVFGWAMYALPAARVQVRVDVERDGRWAPLRAMGPLRERERRLARRRTALGRLASPESFVRTVFASDDTIEAVRITFRRIELDRATDHLVARDQVLAFDRGS